jgi:hypothetical protein
MGGNATAPLRAMGFLPTLTGRIDHALIWLNVKMCLGIASSSISASLREFRSWPDSITDTSGYNF